MQLLVWGRLLLRRPHCLLDVKRWELTLEKKLSRTDVVWFRCLGREYAQKPVRSISGPRYVAFGFQSLSNMGAHETSPHRAHKPTYSQRPFLPLLFLVLFPLHPIWPSSVYPSLIPAMLLFARQHYEEVRDVSCPSLLLLYSFLWPANSTKSAASRALHSNPS